MDFCATFLVPPRIAPFNFDEPIFAGQAAQITCLVSEGDLPLDILWSYNGVSKKSMSELGISTNRFGQKSSQLLIESTAAEHRGNYTCTAKSLSGLQLSSHYSTELNIHGKDSLKTVSTKSESSGVARACDLRFSPYYTRIYPFNDVRFIEFNTYLYNLIRYPLSVFWLYLRGMLHERELYVSIFTMNVIFSIV